MGQKNKVKSKEKEREHCSNVIVPVMLCYHMHCTSYRTLILGSIMLVFPSPLTRSNDVRTCLIASKQASCPLFPKLFCTCYSLPVFVAYRTRRTKELLSFSVLKSNCNKKQHNRTTGQCSVRLHSPLPLASFLPFPYRLTFG